MHAQIFTTWQQVAPRPRPQWRATSGSLEATLHQHAGHVAWVLFDVKAPVASGEAPSVAAARVEVERAARPLASRGWLASLRRRLTSAFCPGESAGPPSAEGS